MPVTLRWLERTTLPVDATGLDPGALEGMSASEIARRRLRVGNAMVEVGELFAVAPRADASDDGNMVMEGDLSHVRRLGEGMARGTLTILGDVGPYLGTGMLRGSIIVRGRAGDWAGAELRGGLIRIEGDAGGFLGASLPGNRLGMRDGVILVRGNIGEDAGRRMRRGLIAVEGTAGDGFGRDLIAGSLFAFGPVGRYPGAGMKRGTLALFHETAPRLPPGFEASGRYRFPFLTLYLRQLAAWGFPVPEHVSSRDFERYNGDLATGGQGEILVAAER